ncbi:hypothetical protein V4210_02265 [Candidatus Nanosynbacter sp. BB002]|uniref:hypothetical protein n=1 Tax=Candidatus Nanosynbacter sp. BB002 TaxID=3393757 RepID=UPI0030CF9F7F
MNKQHHLSKEWLIKKLVFWFWLHMITFGVTAWLAYRKYRNVSFELTDTAIKFRNGRLTRTINYRTIEGFVRNGNTIGITTIGEKIIGGSLVISDIENIDEFESHLEKYLESAK